MTTTPTTDPPIQESAWRRYRAASRHFQPALILLVVMFVILGATQPAFLTSANLINLLTGISVLWIVSLGQTFVVLSGGIDLSVGAIAAMAGIFVGTLDGSLPMPVIVILSIVFGALLGGLCNGVLIGKLRLSFFVVTLATMTALSGVVALWSDSQTFFVDHRMLKVIGYGYVAGVPTTLWLMAGTLALGLFVQSRTYFGRDIYAVGGNVTAARLSGIRAGRTLIAVYSVSGAAAALAGIVAMSRIGAASPQVDASLPLQSAAAVLIGGTLLVGGAGGVVGTAIGTVFIGTVANGLSIAGIPSFWQQVVTGLILVAAVAGSETAEGPLSRLRIRRPPKSSEA